MRHVGAPTGLSAVFKLLIESPVDLGDLCDPALTLPMFQRQDLLVRPVEVKCDISYLLIEPL